MNYAPIIIPTCNRIIHLKRLIESLKNNNWAQYTDLYISVDVPPEERFVDGHEDVVEYVKQITGFNTVKYFIQERNLGAYCNYEFLINKISKSYDSFIFLEDDNEVSANFIEYMDKMLEYFENDSSVFAVCAKNDNNAYRGDGSYYMCQICSPYGLGLWVNKFNNMKTYTNATYFYNTAKSLKKCFKLWNLSELQFMYFAGDLLREVNPMRSPDGDIASIDITMTIAVLLEDMKCVYPLINKCRNWGDDGTGVHSGTQKKVEIVTEKELDTDTEFNIVDGTRQEDVFLVQKHRTRETRKMTLKSNVRSWIVVIAHIILSDKMFDLLRRLIHKEV